MRRVMGMTFKRPHTNTIVKVVGVKRENGRAWVKFAPNFEHSDLCYGRIPVEQFNKLIGRDIEVEEFDVSEAPRAKPRRKKQAEQVQQPEEVK